MKNYLALLMLIVLSLSCAKKKIPEPEKLLGLDYYPTNIGKFVEYEVDSTVYTDLPVTLKTYNYRIKEIITEQFTDNEGKPALKLERYIKFKSTTKPYDSIPYVIKEVWMLNATNKSIQVNERDLRFTKLIFPIELNAAWNGNALNNLGEQLYTYNYVDKTETINNINLEKTLLVTEQDQKNLIELHYSAEKYAKNIGLVERTIKHIYSNNVILNVPIENRIETGIIYNQKIIAYGQQ
jgi:hypothetical protein